jgi:hypothetical protein
MAAETSKGIIYPTSGDNIAPLESHFATLASTTNDALAVLEGTVLDLNVELDNFKTEVGLVPADGSFSFTGPSSLTTPVNLTVPLPSPYFINPPIVVATVSGVTTSSGYVPVVHSITTGQFQARIWRVNENPNLGTATITIATPAVITRTAHGLSEGDKVYFTTTGALPTGISAGTVTTNNYFVRNPAADTFNISSTLTGALINTSGTQSGVHTLRLTAEEALSLNWIAK